MRGLRGWTRSVGTAMALAILSGAFGSHVGAASNPDSVAVIVGNKTYDGGLPAHGHAVNDKNESTGEA